MNTKITAKCRRCQDDITGAVETGKPGTFIRCEKCKIRNWFHILWKPELIYTRTSK